MIKLLLIITSNKIYNYRQGKNKDFDLLYINGEEYFDWSVDSYSDDFETLKEEYLDLFNLEDLSEIHFDIVYQSIEAKIVKKLTDKIFPYASCQINNFESILPDILLKMEKLRPGTSSVSFEATSYMVKMDEQGYIELEDLDDKSELSISHQEIPLHLNMNYEFASNRLDLESKERELKRVLDEKASLSTKVNAMKKELGKLKKKNLSEKRRIIRFVKPGFVKPEGKNPAWRYIFSPLLYKHEIIWIYKSGDLLKRGEDLVKINRLDYDNIVDGSINLKSDSSGRLFVLKEGEYKSIAEGTPIGVIADPSDDMDSIKDWIAKFEESGD